MNVKKSMDWSAANDFLHGLAHVLDSEARDILYDFVQEVRSNKTTKPEDLVQKVLEFLEQKPVKHGKLL